MGPRKSLSLGLSVSKKLLRDCSAHPLSRTQVLEFLYCCCEFEAPTAVTFEIRRFEQHFGYFYGILRVPDEKAFFFGRGQNAPESRAKQALFSLRTSRNQRKNNRIERKKNTKTTAAAAERARGFYTPRHTFNHRCLRGVVTVKPGAGRPLGGAADGRRLRGRVPLRGRGGR